MHLSPESPDAALDMWFGEIFNQYEEPLKGFITARVGRAEDAEDIAQEVWYQFSRSFVQTDIQHIKGWLYQVARRKIIDHYRKHSPELLDEYLFESEDDSYDYDRMDFLTSDDDPELQFLQDQFWDTWYDALDALPANQREVFLLNEWEGITLREIAEKQGVNLKTILSRKRYAVLKLREHLQDVFDDFLVD